MSAGQCCPRDYSPCLRFSFLLWRSRARPFLQRRLPTRLHRPPRSRRCPVSKPTKLPWYIKREPAVTRLSSAELDIDDHFGHEVMSVTAWANGEGFDVQITPDKGTEIKAPLTWQEWVALKRAVRAMQDHDKVA